jgi:DNA (cytosine-5)-methyltransferase 1
MAPDHSGVVRAGSRAAHNAYRLPERYNDAYDVCGDGVCGPGVRYIAESILEPLLEADGTSELIAAE